jgi:hypothetical protein
MAVLPAAPSPYIHDAPNGLKSTRLFCLLREREDELIRGVTRMKQTKRYGAVAALQAPAAWLYSPQPFAPQQSYRPLTGLY